jgi:hypothetical protein
MGGVPWLDSHVQTRQTSKQVVVPRCGLTSDRKAAPRPPAPARRQSQFMWTLKMHVTIIRLQEHSRRYDAANDRGFALQSTFFGVLQRRAARKTSLEAIKHEKPLTVPEALFHWESVPL